MTTKTVRDLLFVFVALAFIINHGTPVKAGACDVVTTACGGSPSGLQGSCNAMDCDMACATINGGGLNGPGCVSNNSSDWSSTCGAAYPSGTDGSGNQVYCSSGGCGCGYPLMQG